jgi:hypothetical protein
MFDRPVRFGGSILLEEAPARTEALMLAEL